MKPSYSRREFIAVCDQAAALALLLVKVAPFVPEGRPRAEVEDAALAVQLWLREHRQ